MSYLNFPSGITNSEDFLPFGSSRTATFPPEPVTSRCFPSGSNLITPGAPTSDLKSEVGAPGEIKSEPDGKHLLVTGSGGKVAVLELPKGKKSSEFVIPLGK